MRPPPGQRFASIDRHPGSIKSHAVESSSWWVVSAPIKAAETSWSGGEKFMAARVSACGCGSGL
jgi:hypothetical protein